MDSSSDSILNIQELSQYLKVPKSTLYKIARQGLIPSQKVGRHWRFRKRAIDLWLQESRACKPDEGEDR